MKRILIALSMIVMAACAPKQDLDGVWINVEYDRTLSETKSPMESQGAAEYSMVEIDSSATNILVIINLHEGMNEPIQNKDGELSFDLYDGTSVPIKPDGDQLLVGDSRFMRLAEANFQEYINKNTLEGTYETPEGTKVVFNTDGTLSGLAEYTNYSVMYDYYGDGTSVNIVEISGNGIGTPYTWEAKDGLLSLFNVTYADPESQTQASRGELAFQLKKQ